MKRGRGERGVRKEGEEPKTSRVYSQTLAQLSGSGLNSAP